MFLRVAIKVDGLSHPENPKCLEKTIILFMFVWK